MTRSFQPGLAARIALLVLVSLATGWCLASHQAILSTLLLIAVIILLGINLVWFINTTNRKINFFFESIVNEDYGLTIPLPRGDKTLHRLSENLKKVAEQIKRIQIDNQRQEQYLATIIEHVATGILSVDTEGFVVHANSNLKRMLGLGQLTHLRQLDKVDAHLARAVRTIRSNDEKLITVQGPGGPITLLLKATSILSGNRTLKLLSVQDIKKELDEKELDSWLKLIRILTHEIMNSIAPVTALSDDLYHLYSREGVPIPVTSVNEALIDTTIRGLRVIREQGQGLTRFVENYRKLTRLPKPETKRVSVKYLFEKSILLFESDQPRQNIEVEYSLENPGQELEIDEGLVSQVLANLLRNAAEALRETPKAHILLSCSRNPSGQVELAVTDNGPGVAPELLDEIFVPFFTTREDGNGIGLSLSRQIMRMHNGSLTVSSVPGRRTTFTMVFPHQQ